MLTEAGLPGWFPGDFSTDPALHAAFDDSAGWHAAGRKKREPRKPQEHATITEQAIGLAANVTVDPEAMESPGLPVPGDPDAVSMFTAHRVDEIAHKLSHAAGRMTAARSATGNLRKYHAARLAGHLKAALGAAHDLTAGIRGHYPAEAAELEQVKDAVGLAVQAIALTGDGHGHHVPGTPNVYGHGWRPLDGTEAGEDGIRMPGKGTREAKAPGITERADAPAAAKAEPSDVIAQYQSWRDHLTPAEGNALRFYQSPGFALMNGQLRGLDPEKLKAGEHAADDDLKRARQASKALAGAIAKAPPLKQDTTVYRGFDAAQFGELKPGKVITDPGFTSTSVTDDAGAVGKAKTAGQMELTLPAGTKAGAGSVRELILPPGSSMRVTGVTRKGGVTHVKAELVPPGSSHAGGAAGAVLLAKAVSDDAKAATTAHLLETTLHELTHGSRHAQAMLEDTPDDEQEFNADHCAKHLGGAAEHAGKLRDHFADNYPAVSRWLKGLGEVTPPGVEDGGGKSGHARYSKGDGGTITAQMASGDTVTGQIP